MDRTLQKRKVKTERRYNKVHSGKGGEGKDWRSGIGEAREGKKQKKNVYDGNADLKKIISRDPFWFFPSWRTGRVGSDGHTEGKKLKIPLVLGKF